MARVLLAPVPAAAESKARGRGLSAGPGPDRPELDLNRRTVVVVRRGCRLLLLVGSGSYHSMFRYQYGALRPGAQGPHPAGRAAAAVSGLEDSLATAA